MRNLKKVALGIGVAFAFLMILPLIVNNSSTNSNQPQKVVPLGEVSRPAKVGDTVVVGDLSYIVSNALMTEQVGEEYFNVNAQGVFIVVNMDVLNNGKESKQLLPYYFKLVDSKGRKFDGDNKAWIYLGDNVFLKQLQPNLLTKAQLVFDVPRTREAYALEITNGFYGDDKKYIILDKYDSTNGAKSTTKEDANTADAVKAALNYNEKSLKFLDDCMNGSTYSDLELCKLTVMDIKQQCSDSRLPAMEVCSDPRIEKILAQNEPFKNYNPSQSSENNEHPIQSEQKCPGPLAYTVTISENKFEPKTLVISSGDSIVFKTADKRHEIASSNDGIQDIILKYGRIVELNHDVTMPFSNKPVGTTFEIHDAMNPDARVSITLNPRPSNC